MIRIPCTGRISKALVFKAFEMGADGMALLACEPGSCRYGSGTVVAEPNVDDTRGILHHRGTEDTEQPFRIKGFSSVSSVPLW